MLIIVFISPTKCSTDGVQHNLRSPVHSHQDASDRWVRTHGQSREECTEEWAPSPPKPVLMRNLFSWSEKNKQCQNPKSAEGEKKNKTWLDTPRSFLTYIDREADQWKDERKKRGRISPSLQGYSSPNLRCVNQNNTSHAGIHSEILWSFIMWS